MTDATELDLDAIRARVEAASDGPWEVAEDDYPQPDDSVVLADGHAVGACPDCGVRAGYPRADAEFIAHARTDVERLLTALDEAREDAASKARWIAQAKEREDRHVARAAAAEAALDRVRALLTHEDGSPRYVQWIGDELRAALDPAVPATEGGEEK